MDRNTSCVKILKEWLPQQPHLPQNIPDAFLMKFFITSNYSIEVAKNLLDIFFTMRSRNPDLFSNRSLGDPEIQDTMQILNVFRLRKIVQNKGVLVIRLASDDFDKYDCLASLKIFTMFDDVHLLADETPPEGEIGIVDIEKASLKLIPKIALMQVKKAIDYVQEARPVVLKEIHFVNAPAIIDKLLLLFKPFIKSELWNMFQFHPNLESLHKFVPKDILPEEYGGTAGKIENYLKEWEDKVRKHNVFLDDESYWKVDESKRPAGNPFEDKFGVQGSFRTIDID